MNLKQTCRLFAKALSDSSASPFADARVILSSVMGIKETQFISEFEKEVPPDKEIIIKEALRRRLNGEPVAYITGERGFYQYVFKVTKDVLIPRPDTETLVESAVEDIKVAFKDKTEINILDLCCGSGCIGISAAKALVKNFKRISLTLSDISDGALEVCRENIKSLITESNIKAEIVKSSLFDSLAGRSFDAILSNPPYIKTSVIETLETQVQFEPHIALDGGKDGLDFIRAIARQAKNSLVPKGLLQMEIGYDQSPAAAKILKEENFSDVSVLKDLGQRERVVKGRN
ncbi:MAG: peptide chain release factor N(5)-glutamine methyltransferase [Spirochaetales bacterium]